MLIYLLHCFILLKYVFSTYQQMTNLTHLEERLFQFVLNPQLSLQTYTAQVILAGIYTVSSKCHSHIHTQTHTHTKYSTVSKGKRQPVYIHHLNAAVVTFSPHFGGYDVCLKDAKQGKGRPFYNILL